MSLGHRPHCVDTTKCAWPIDRRKIKIGSSCTLGSLIVLREFPGQQTACQWAPDQNTQSLVQRQRYDFAFQIPAGEGVIRLHTFETIPAVMLRNGNGFHDLPGSVVAQPDIANLA